MDPMVSDLLKGFGLPTTLLFIMMWFAFKSLKWIGENVVVPLTKKHIEYMDSSMQAMAAIAASQTVITDTMKQIVPAIATLAAKAQAHETTTLTMEKPV